MVKNLKCPNCLSRRDLRVFVGVQIAYKITNDGLVYTEENPIKSDNILWDRLAVECSKCNIMLSEDSVDYIDPSDFPE